MPRLLAISVLVSFLSSLLILAACSDNDGSVTSSEVPESSISSSIELTDLARWQRVDGPILRDPEPIGGYEVAADQHVFRDENDRLHMVYTGPHSDPDNDFASIKLTTSDSHNNWSAGVVLLSGSNSGGADLHKETSFYRRADSGKHQIYYIGYEDGAVYQSQIFMAEADELTGPYTLPSGPVIKSGVVDGFNVHTITSPSIVEHEGLLYMVYCAWNAFPEPTAVQIHGAVSDDDGITWDVIGEVSTPVGMEGAMTKGADGLFYAVSSIESGQAVALGRSHEPFGVYTMLEDSVISSLGAPWEIDEVVAPQLLFEGSQAYLYYTGADYVKGWWVMLATTELSSLDAKEPVVPQ